MLCRSLRLEELGVLQVDVHAPTRRHADEVLVRQLRVGNPQGIKDFDDRAL
ncbi:hypothetical protein BH24ACT26_BH24ACT26_16370 [soil metagenome]